MQFIQVVRLRRNQNAPRHDPEHLLFCVMHENSIRALQVASWW
jgi:hypothetical protein